MNNDLNLPKNSSDEELKILNLHGLENHIAEIISPILDSLGYEPVNISVLGHENPTIQIMADKKGGMLISVEDCEQISHALGAVLDVDDPLTGKWNLEISSAGIDRSLTRIKDWRRFKNQLVRVELSIPIEGRKRFLGIIGDLSFNDGWYVTLKLNDLNDDEKVILPIFEVRKASLLLTDELIEFTSQGRKSPGGHDIPKLNAQKPGQKRTRKKK